jgi:hypothetical protein
MATSLRRTLVLIEHCAATQQPSHRYVTFYQIVSSLWLKSVLQLWLKPFIAFHLTQALRLGLVKAKVLGFSQSASQKK